ncbi:MAG: glycoside hydrolase family 1 protein [Deltaproteobacteria bacterium]|nr:glycoside hydrolase family 1 protein [Deltaproteobacteria bacterium]MBI3293344.1 glycoside hydrolase family 1 protein [Deltaproteobacteria bacterium]
MTAFLWGAATSSHQIEGNNIHNDWWDWESQGNIEGGEGSGLTCDHWNRFAEDLDLARDLGLNSYRFSVEWSRIEPECGRWNKEALDWYENLIGECEKRNLIPMLTLHHFTTPLWFAREGGFTTEKSANWFAGYVKRVVERVGKRVPLWCTLNEPNTLVVGQYIASYMPPATYSPRSVSKASRNLLRAHVQAYDIIHSKIQKREGPFRDHPIAVGIAHNMIDFHPLRTLHPIDRMVTSLFRRFYNRSWPDAVTGNEQHFGVLGIIPMAAQVPQARGRKTVDFLGVNYYTRVFVACRPFNHGDSPDLFPTASSSPVGIVFSKKGDRLSDLGWAIHPTGLGDMCHFLKGYGVPLYITENGIADHDDDLRPDYLFSHLTQVAQAITEGIDLRGYFHWSLLDNFEWVKGFGPRFGLCAVDYKTQKRSIRRSGQLYREIIAAHGYSAPSVSTLETLCNQESL